MKEFKDRNKKLTMITGQYTDGNLYIGFIEKKTGEDYVDVTVNTPYSAKNTIVLDDTLLSICPKLAESFINEYCDGKITDVECGYLTLPKYYVKLDKVYEDSIHLQE